MPKMVTNKPKWEIEHGPQLDDVLLAILFPRENLTFQVTVRDTDSKQGHQLTIAVNKIWGGSDLSSVRGWTGMVGFEGTTPSLFLAECPNLIAQVSVCFTVGEETGRLTLVELTPHE